MLRGIRKASSNWIGKTIMAVVVGVLVLSFAIWGIGDIFRGFGRSTVAKIGGTEISIEQFRTLYNDRLQQYARQLGRPISADQARALGLDRIVISQLLSDVALDERARSLGLNVSDQDVIKRITDDPSFKGPNGQFDRFRFEQIIRQAGYTESRFISEQRRQMLRRQLATTIVSGDVVSNAMIEAANRYQNEQRAIDYVLLDRSKAGEIEPPSPEALAKYFEERKILFRAPEYRKLLVVSLIPSEQAPWIEISDADLKAAYEARRERYVNPERRHIQQIVFPNEADAKAASERLAKGESFVDIAKERGLSEKDIDLGTLTKAAVIDRAVADAAFTLKEGDISPPVPGRFGTAIVRVLKIEPEQVKPIDEVANDLKREIGLERARADILKMYDKIEDARTDGKTLTEAAEALKLAPRTIEAIDRSGRAPTGLPIAVPDPQRLLPGAFAADIGAERDPLQFEGGYVWYEVLGITPSRDRPLDEVKDQVEARWREQEIASRLKAKATEVLDKLKAGTPFADVAAADQLTVQTLGGIKRADTPPPLSAAAVEAIFRTAKDGFGMAEAAQAAEQIVFKVNDIVIPTLDVANEEAKRAKDTLNRAVTEDIFSEYIARLESELGVTINQSALNQVISGGAVDTN